MHGGNFESPSSRRVCTVSNRRSAHDGVHNRAVGWPLSVASARDDHHRLHQLLFSSLIYSSPPVPWLYFLTLLLCSLAMLLAVYHQQDSDSCRLYNITLYSIQSTSRSSCPSLPSSRSLKSIALAELLYIIAGRLSFVSLFTIRRRRVPRS